MEEEGQQRDSELWDGLDDEIDRLAPSPERLRDISIFSPQRAFTGSCADQVLSRTPDLFAIECEWASFPMYSPQRSPTGCCADQEQSLEVLYASNMTMSSGSSRNFEEGDQPW